MNSKNKLHVTIGTSNVIKRIMLLCLTCCLIILFTACSPADASGPISPEETSAAAIDSETGNDLPDPTDKPAESNEPVDNTGSDWDASFDSDDLEIVVDDISCKMLEDASGLLAALGQDFEYSEAESCVFEGMDKTFDFGDVLVYTVPSGDVDLLDGYDILGGNQQTSAGIGLGSTRQDVLAAYGEPADDSDYMIFNESGDPEKIDEPRLTIVLDGNGIVEMISYYSGSNAQG